MGLMREAVVQLLSFAPVLPLPLKTPTQSYRIFDILIGHPGFL